MWRDMFALFLQIRSDQISHSVVSDSWRPHESQHARPPCPSPTPRVHWNSCPSSQWCHPAISSSVVPFSSCPQTLPNIRKTFQHQFWYFCCSVAQSCPPLCDHMDCSISGLPVLHHLPEFAQTHAQWVSDAIQPSRPLSLHPPPALNLSRHQGLFQWVDSSHQVAKVLELQLPHQSSNAYSRLISFRIDWFDVLAAQGTLKRLLQLHRFDISGRFILCPWSGWECAFVFLICWVFVTHCC